MREGVRTVSFPGLHSPYCLRVCLLASFLESTSNHRLTAFVCFVYLMVGWLAGWLAGFLLAWSCIESRDCCISSTVGMKREREKKTERKTTEICEAR